MGLFRTRPEYNTKCWNSVTPGAPCRGTYDDLYWREGFGYGRRCRCGDNPDTRAADARLTLRQIRQHANRLRPFDLPRETFLRG